MFERLVALSGLPPIRLHDLRRVAATPLLATGADLLAVREVPGHSSVTTTADVHASVLSEPAFARAEAAAALAPRARSLTDTRSAPAPGVDSSSAHAVLTQTAPERNSTPATRSSRGATLQVRGGIAPSIQWAARGSNPEPTD
ncbi:tyrosine-type recombinase/integrase [Kitasatospora sp. NPDC088346]|uniref:tyrosine-type recombinase/integrase n=1 Tax=Kitasatospora sp. NPDC088346 TaxID=3364073 RepID=UPI0037F13E43